MIRRSHAGMFFLSTGLFFALGAGQAAAQQDTETGAKSAPPAFPSFSARRVAAPKAGSPPKITIQITEPDPVSANIADKTENGVAADGQANTQASALGRYSWFWVKVPAGLQHDGDSSRLDLALTALTTAKAPVSAPGLQLMQQIIEEQARPILMSSAGTKVSPALVLAVIAVESAGKSDAVSGAGASGLMQLMPDTASRFGVSDALVAEQNIRGGIQYLDWLLGEFKGDPILALAGYNAGEGAVRTHQGVPPFAETRDYVPKVLAAYQVARALCMTPPELISDGCVFRQVK